MREGWEIAHELIKVGQEKYKAGYDLRTQTFKGKVGDKVLYREKAALENSITNGADLTKMKL